MSTEENKAIVRRLFSEALDRGNLAALDELVAPTFRFHVPGSPVPLDRESAKHFTLMFRTAFPDLQHTIEDLVSEGDKVVARLTVRGTHHGDFQGMPATGKPMAVSAIHVFRRAGGRIVEQWGVIDQLGMVQQLGLMPAPAQAASA